ncbi:hypothetical protein HYW46_01215 [Candidatus Daviesbacteria bacterium]|nr:hypothetical protein [Candidatus Daviesbacteria bacterium]
MLNFRFNTRSKSGMAIRRRQIGNRDSMESHVRKVLTDLDQRLILMVRN